MGRRYTSGNLRRCWGDCVADSVRYTHVWIATSNSGIESTVGIEDKVCFELQLHGPEFEAAATKVLYSAAGNIRMVISWVIALSWPIADHWSARVSTTTTPNANRNNRLSTGVQYYSFTAAMQLKFGCYERG